MADSLRLTPVGFLLCFPAALELVVDAGEASALIDLTGITGVEICGDKEAPCDIRMWNGFMHTSMQRIFRTLLSLEISSRNIYNQNDKIR